MLFATKRPRGVHGQNEAPAVLKTGFVRRSPVLICLLLVASALAQLPASAQRSVEAWYLVFEVDREGAIELYASQRVQLASLAESGPTPDTAVGEDLFRVQLSDAAGELHHEQWVKVPTIVRGEFHGEPTAGGHAIESHHFEPERRAFVVRVPAIAQGSLVIEGRRTTAFAVADIAERSLQRPTVSARVARMESPASSANRVDVVILGDGYRAEEEAKFDEDATTIANAFLAISPYAEYRNFAKVTTLFVPSAESGADHPPYDASCPWSPRPTCCADAAAKSDPLAGTFVDTALDGQYCGGNIFRLVVVDYAKVLAAAAAVPDWDRILVLLNDGTLGGSGGFVAVSSTHPNAVDIVRHEYGHSFTGLADEYETETPNPACSDRAECVPAPDLVCPCFPNVTDETTRSLIKWEHWIHPATPVPTPETDVYADLVGLFEGAFYRAEGMYRPRHSCLMRNLGAPFGEICREQYVLKLYRGGWGVPGDGIDLIEPGSVSPLPDSVVEYEGEPILFEADLLQPVGSPPLDVSWSVDGVPVASGEERFPTAPRGVAPTRSSCACATPRRSSSRAAPMSSRAGVAGRSARMSASRATRRSVSRTAGSRSRSSGGTSRVQAETGRS